MSSKVVSVDEALVHIRSGCTLMFGGFGGVGSPPTIIDALIETGTDALQLIGNDAGFPDVGIGRLICAGRAKSLITSHIGSNPVAGKLMTDGKLKVSFFPQGTLAEKIRAGGVGLGGILTDVGLDTVVEQGKSVVELDGKRYILETPLTADVGIVYAKAADPYGNLIYSKSARNFNPLVATACKITIAEVEELVDTLDPEAIVTPGVFVHYIVKSKGVPWKWAWQQNAN